MDAYTNPAIVPVGVTPAVQFEIIPFYRHFFYRQIFNKQKCTQTFVAFVKWATQKKEAGRKTLVSPKGGEIPRRYFRSLQTLGGVPKWL